MFCASQAFPKMFSPVPNGEQILEGVESEGNSADISYAEDSEGSSEESEESEDAESPPRTEQRTKRSQDPAANRGKAVASSAKNPKRTRTGTPDPTEKAAKQPKVATPKPRKALPRMKVAVPIIST